MKKKHYTSHSKAMDLVLKCGVPPDLAGCSYLAEAIELRTLFNTSAMEIYRTIAEKHSIQPKSVLRDIAYALSKSYSLSGILSRLLGDIPIDKKLLHNDLVISYLSLKLDSEISKDEDKDREN